MKKLLFLVPLACLAACQGDESLPQVLPQEQVVTIGSVLDNHADFEVYAGGTRRSAYQGTEPEAGNPLNAFVWSSTTSATYPHSNTSGDGSQSNGYVVTKHAYAAFYSKSTALDRAGQRGFVFPVNGKVTPDVYFVGLAPAVNDEPNNDLWTTNASSTQAIFTFHGNEDVMYAPEVSGHYSGDIPLLHFYHLLTHLRFVFKCEGDTEEAREEVSYAWGKIKNIKLVKQNNGADNPRNKVTIDLSRVATSLTQVESRSAFTSTADYLSLYKKGSDVYFPQNPAALVDDESKHVEIPVSEDGEELAYLLCAPVTATAGTVGALTDEYTLLMNTEKRSNVSIPIDLMVGKNSYFSGSTMGCEFVVTLTFRFGKVIATATAMYDWSQEGGQSPVDIKDE